MNEKQSGKLAQKYHRIYKPTVNSSVLNKKPKNCFYKKYMKKRRVINPSKSRSFNHLVEGLYSSLRILMTFLTFYVKKSWANAQI